MDTSAPAGATLSRVRPPAADSPAGGDAVSSPGSSLALPPDLLDQVRGRIRLLAGLLFIGFGIDLLLFTGAWIYARFTGVPVPAGSFQGREVQWVNILAVLASGGLWWAARRERVAPSRLHTLALVYEVCICFAIAMVTFWQEFLTSGRLPNLTWVPAVVIMFPLVMPGPPRRMLVAATLAALTSPGALLLLALSGRVTVDSPGAYFQAGFGPLVAVCFAYLAADVVHGLGREVVRAREMGSYRLGALLGRGGMGEVYHATHRMLARPAAIKLIRPEMLYGGDGEAATQAARRFRREAEAAASLRSPHTVELYDFGITEDRTPYLVMELLDGLDLETLVRQQGPLPAGRVIHILRQVCESLEEAHARGLVHRDIKPANIHLGRLGLRHDFVKVLDFGLVRSVSADPAGESHPARAGFAAGTPAYLAPEAALGEPVDGRADIYALGCVAYYLLTGGLVFEGGNELQVITRHLRDAPVPPSQRTELPIPAALERLVLACLEKTPAERPPSAGALAASLAAVSTEPWGEPEAATWWSRHRPAP